MASFPDHLCCIAFAGFSESFDPSVQRTEMERGPAKQMVMNTNVESRLNVTLIFKSAADAMAFEDWYFNEIQRIGWFDMEHPRHGFPIQARFPGGVIGDLVPIAPQFGALQRSCAIEFYQTGLWMAPA